MLGRYRGEIAFRHSRIAAMWRTSGTTPVVVHDSGFLEQEHQEEIQPIL